MKKNKADLWIWLLIGILTAITFITAIYAAVLYFQDNSKSISPSPTPAPFAFRKSLIPLEELNNSGQSGYAEIEELAGGKVKVKISLAGENPRVAQPAHIHTGQCPRPGAIKHNLTNLISNLSETVLDISYDALLTSGQLAINVHKSTTEASVYTACGNIPEDN